MVPHYVTDRVLRLYELDFETEAQEQKEQNHVAKAELKPELADLVESLAVHHGFYPRMKNPAQKAAEDPRRGILADTKMIPTPA